MTDRENELPLKWDQEVAYIGPMVSRGTVYGYKTVGSKHPHAVPVISRDKAESQLTELRRQVASLKEALEKVKQGLRARLQANEPAPEPID